MGSLGFKRRRWRTTLQGLRRGFFPLLLLSLLIGDFLVPLVSGPRAVPYPLSFDDCLGVLTLRVIVTA